MTVTAAAYSPAALDYFECHSWSFERTRALNGKGPKTVQPKGEPRRS